MKPNSARANKIAAIAAGVRRRFLRTGVLMVIRGCSDSRRRPACWTFNIVETRAFLTYYRNRSGRLISRRLIRRGTKGLYSMKARSQGLLRRRVYAPVALLWV